MTQREKQVKTEELEGMPTYEELVRITQKLATRYTVLEKTIEKMEKVTSGYTKCKINAEQWLNEHVTPEYSYDELNHRIRVEQDDISMLFESKVLEIFATLMDRHIHKQESPLACINNKLYVYKSEKYGWVVTERKDVVTIMNTFLQRIMDTLTKWRCENADRIAKNDTLSIEYNKVLIKLMNTNFNQDSMFGKIKTHLGNIVKFDVVNTIEYVVV
jgi:hypothetical protein